MKKIFSTFLILLALGGGYIGFNASHKLAEKNTSQNVLQAGSHSPNTQIIPTKIPEAVYGIPKTLQIAKINVNSPVESVGQDQQKAMDVPKDSDDAGWYDLGVKPGEKGSAVLDGHLDKSSGAPAVFWNVSKLEVGDKIIVRDDLGHDHTFAVTEKAQYPYNDFPLQKVFGATDKRMLNLISCNGQWNTATKNYSHRTVIYSQLAE